MDKWLNHLPHVIWFFEHKGLSLTLGNHFFHVFNLFNGKIMGLLLLNSMKMYCNSQRTWTIRCTIPTEHKQWRDYKVCLQTAPAIHHGGQHCVNDRLRVADLPRTPFYTFTSWEIVLVANSKLNFTLGLSSTCSGWTGTIWDLFKDEKFQSARPWRVQCRNKKKILKDNFVFSLTGSRLVLKYWDCTWTI